MFFFRACFCPLMSQVRGSHDVLREKPSSLLMVGWSSISIASDDVVHVSQLRGQNTGVVFC
jgi:hypothetical protein